MRVAIYIRVSTKMQIERYSLEDQERACRAHAEMRSWSVVGVYVDKAESGRRDDRPELQRLKDDARRRRFDVVLVFKLNRFARNVPDQYKAAAELEALGVEIASATETFDRKTAAGRLTFGMLAVIAQFDSDQQGERVKSAKQMQAQRGDWVGPPPYGAEKPEKVLVWKGDADTEAARLIFELYETGRHSYLSIADELNDRGYTTFDPQTKQRGTFGRENIRGILKNPAYIGRVRCDGQEYAGGHPPLIAQETWERCKELREGRARKGGYANVQDKTGRLLSGLARCVACGESMWAHPSSNDYYYRCAGRDHRTCQAPTVRAYIVEEQALEAVKLLALPGDWQQEIIRQAEALMEPKERKPAANPATIEAQLRRLALVYAAGDIDEATYQQQRATWRRRLEEATAAPVPAPGTFDVRRALAMLADMAGLVERANEVERRGILRAVFACLWLERHRVAAITPTTLYAPMLGAIEEMRGGGGLGRVPDGFPHPVLTLPPYWTAHQIAYKHAS